MRSVKMQYLILNESMISDRGKWGLVGILSGN